MKLGELQASVLVEKNLKFRAACSEAQFVKIAVAVFDDCLAVYIAGLDEIRGPCWLLHVLSWQRPTILSNAVTYLKLRLFFPMLTTESDLKLEVCIDVIYSQVAVLNL